MTSKKLKHGPTGSAALLSADRASFEMRRGRPLCVFGGDEAPLLVVPTETVTERALSLMYEISRKEPDLAITHHRARTLKVRLYTEEIVLVPFPGWLTADMARSLADPTTDLDHPLRGPFTAKRGALPAGAIAAVQLAKAARLLPSVILVSIDQTVVASLEEKGILSVSTQNALDYEYNSSATLKQVAAARVPLENAENTRIFAFRSTDGGREHLAIVIGNPPSDTPVLIRLHSECFTGDLIGSLKCDCGQQLRGAITQISEEGAGVLLYLRQEGRGIGLLNKLRAYDLQGQGYDTVEANERLGFDSDERLFMPAAHILKQLGYRKVRLMTNNPDKVLGLQQYDIEVTERVEHKFPSNEHNEFYLSVKREKSGHLL
ncbi:MAG: GTP cyclohydrolase II [Rhodospirillaceae bacterium]